ncbi:SRPBCC domain-containing protein [Compostibacter hankyongensis]|uniref:SRPBCC family protein n=1 Tax=Compostibacter hankyongensis TaxID=1007089 RepID=A0ABP8FKG0_9BACT
MEQKTKVLAEKGQQEVVITREFDLPAALVFKAYTDPDILAQWMGTKVLKLESKDHGSYRFETRDKEGKTVFQANGTIHACVPDRKIIRTFEMDNTPYGVQLEIIAFEALTENTSRLIIHSVYESVTQRDEVMKLPFAQGINWAHNRLQDVVSQLK